MLLCIRLNVVMSNAMLGRSLKMHVQNVVGVRASLMGMVNMMRDWPVNMRERSTNLIMR